MICRLIAAVLFACQTTAVRAEVPPLVQTGDFWALHRPTLPSYGLLGFITRPEQEHRLFAGAERLGATLDVLGGTQLPVANHWHGHYLADLRLGVRPVRALEVDLDLLAYNVSASGTYREYTGLAPGLSVYLDHPLAELGDETLKVEVLVGDLGSVTLGEGLLFERVPMEGSAYRLSWDPLYLRAAVAGQVHGIEDDLFVFSLGCGPTEASWLVWNQVDPATIAHLLSLGAHLRGEHLGLAAEGALRLPDDLGDLAGAALLRADWRPPPWVGLRFHLGSQVRWYGQGIGPTGDALFPATLGHATPRRDQAYVTQAFEAWWPSAFYHQLWWANMAEVRWTVDLTDVAPGLGRWTLGLDLEARIMAYNDPHPPLERLPVAHPELEPTDVFLPDTRYQLFHRTALDWHPVPHPFRLGLALTNRGADGLFPPHLPTPVAVVERDVFVSFEVEVEL